MASEHESDELEVVIGEISAGILRRNRNDGVEFVLRESYRSRQLKPVLGQRFLDDPGRIWQVRSRVPEWFSNLLPEGVLRELVARQAAVPPQREFFLLRHLGQDLPGAVRILSPQAEIPFPLDESMPSYDPGKTGIDEWHFSLAGIQLKFSARENARGLTIPVGGTGGDWIVKLPDHRFGGIPENEFATMQWAEASGIEVPPHRLVPVGKIDGLPESMGKPADRMAYAVQRFDRGVGGKRIHIEDFAQVLDVYPEEKYDRHNYETLANVVSVLDGTRGLKAFIRQLVFIFASGNGDAHLKNWSLIYPDGNAARLSPAYDLVSTIQYLPEEKLALNFARSKQWSDVSMAGFIRLARKIGWSEPLVREMVEESVDAVLSAWMRSKSDFGYPSRSMERIEAHVRTVPLLQSPLRS